MLRTYLLSTKPAEMAERRLTDTSFVPSPHPQVAPEITPLSIHKHECTRLCMCTCLHVRHRPRAHRPPGHHPYPYTCSWSSSPPRSRAASPRPCTRCDLSKISLIEPVHCWYTASLPAALCLGLYISFASAENVTRVVTRRHTRLCAPVHFLRVRRCVRACVRLCVRVRGWGGGGRGARCLCALFRAVPGGSMTFSCGVYSLFLFRYLYYCVRELPARRSGSLRAAQLFPS